MVHTTLTHAALYVAVAFLLVWFVFAGVLLLAVARLRGTR